MSYAGLGVIIIGAILILVDQAQTYWDAKASVDATKATVSSVVGKVEKTEEEWKNGMTSVYNRQMDIEAKLAAAEVKLQKAYAEADEKMALFRKEQARLRNTIAPRQINPAIKAPDAPKYDGEKVRRDLEALQKKFDAIAGRALKKSRKPRTK